MKKLFFDLETTGTDIRKHSIHQIAGIVEINGKVAESFNLLTQPHPKALIEPEVMKIGGVTEDQIWGYPPMQEMYKALLRKLGKYVDRYDKTDKLHLVGFNNRAFDDRFLRAWFEHNDDPYFGSWFWSDSLDVMVLASQYLLHTRHLMKNFKLPTVAKELGIKVEEQNLHDGQYDVQITRQIYGIVSTNLLE